MDQYPGEFGDLTWGKPDYPVAPVQKEALDILWSLLTGLAVSKAQVKQIIVIAGHAQNPYNGTVTLNLFHHVIHVERNGHIVARKEEDASEV